MVGKKLSSTIPVLQGRTQAARGFTPSFPPHEQLGLNFRSAVESDGHNRVVTWHQIVLGREGLTLPSLGSPPAIFGPRLCQFEAELLWSGAFNKRGGLTFPHRKGRMHFIHRDWQHTKSQTEFSLLTVSMYSVCWVLKFGKEAASPSFKLTLVNGDCGPIQGSSVHSSCSLHLFLCPWLVGSQ